MSEQLLAKAGSFCWNPDCADYAKTARSNLRKYGTTRKGTQRYQCRACQKVFSQLRGTLFHNKQHSPETIIEWCVRFYLTPKKLELLEAACRWEDALYNFNRPCKSLRIQLQADLAGQKWQPRTPAIAAGLSDHIWDVKELLTLVVIPEHQFI